MVQSRSDRRFRPEASSRPAGRGWHRLVGRIFGGEAVTDQVVTQMACAVPPEEAWERIVFYEQVMARPPFPLRAFVPQPLGTEGAKDPMGSVVRCVYYGGELVKQITAMAPPRRIWFRVLEQRLGIESCVQALDGSYEFRSYGSGCTVVLTTRYKAFLHPRWLWRPIEKMLTSQLHGHILESMRATTDGKTVTLVDRAAASISAT